VQAAKTEAGGGAHGVASVGDAAMAAALRKGGKGNGGGEKRSRVEESRGDRRDATAGGQPKKQFKKPPAFGVHQGGETKR